MNWGQLGAWAGAIISLISSIGYLYVGDTRRSLYFFFGFCITAVVAWK